MKCEICGKEFTSHTYSGEFSNICKNSECFEAKYWQSKIKCIQINPLKYVIIDGKCYYINDEHNIIKGFSGKHFKIQRNDGSIIATSNLWYNGEIPSKFRKILPDNAKFIEIEKEENQ